MTLNHSLRVMIERVPWHTLEHAYGKATDAPEALAALASRDPEERERASEFLFYSAHHQGTVYSATVEVVSILIEMLATEGFPDKPRLLYALNLMFHGTSYHEVHRGMMLMGNTDTPEYQAKVDLEVSWVKEIQRRIRDSLAVYLPLLTANDAETRLYAPLLLRSLADDYSAIRPVAVAAFAQETETRCRASTLLLMGNTGEPIRPLWDAGLNRDPSRLMRVIAATRVVRQERENAPPDAIETLLEAMTQPDEELLADYGYIPTQGNFIADLGAALSFSGRSNIERVIDNLIVSLQAGPDANMQRTDLMLQLSCVLAQKVPYPQPETLNALEQRIARECRRQLGLEMAPGLKMSGFINFTDILRNYGLPTDETKFDDYLAKLPRA